MNEEQFNKIVQWQDATFPNSNALSKIAHLDQEVEELKLDCEGQLKGLPSGYQSEFADCLILLFGAASKMGMDYNQLWLAVETKMLINKNRVWGKPDAKGVVNHVKHTCPLCFSENINVIDGTYECDTCDYEWGAIPEHRKK